MSSSSVGWNRNPGGNSNSIVPSSISRETKGRRKRKRGRKNAEELLRINVHKKIYIYVYSGGGKNKTGALKRQKTKGY